MRWKWFQRQEEPIDCTGQATAYPARAGAYSRSYVDSRVPPAWNAPTQAEPQDRPLMTRAGLWRSSHALKLLNSRWR